MRKLVLVLLMLNLLYLLWALLRPVPGPAVIDADNRFRESLTLLKDVDHALLVPVSGGEPGNEPGNISVAEQSPAACLVLGPFASESDLRQFADAQMLDRQWRIGAEEVALPPLYRVYVPPADTGPQGMALLASVREAIVDADFDVDSYLVVGGELGGAVSLGLFAAQDNARRVHEQISGLGIAVEMQPENRTRILYSIIIAGEEDSDFIQESAAALQARDAEAGITEKLCEMIALPD